MQEAAKVGEVSSTAARTTSIVSDGSRKITPVPSGDEGSVISMDPAEWEDEETIDAGTNSPPPRRKEERGADRQPTANL